MPLIEFEAVGDKRRVERWYEQDELAALPEAGEVVMLDGVAFRRLLPTLAGILGAKDESFRSLQPTLWDPTVRHHTATGEAVFRNRAEAREWAARNETEHGGYKFDA